MHHLLLMYSFFKHLSFEAFYMWQRDLYHKLNERCIKGEKKLLLLLFLGQKPFTDVDLD